MEVVNKKKTGCNQTLISFLNFAHQKLLQAEVASPRLDAEVLMAENLNISRAELMTYPGRLLTCVEAGNFLSKSRDEFCVNRFLTLSGLKNSGHSNF